MGTHIGDIYGGFEIKMLVIIDGKESSRTVVE